MKKIIIAVTLVTCFVISVPLLFAEEYRLLYRSPQVDRAFPAVGLDPKNGTFTTRFYVWSSTAPAPLVVHDLEGNKLREKDISRWREQGTVSVPSKKLYVYTELTICPKPLEIEVCDYNPEGYMYDVEKSTFLYHSDKFVRNYPDFTIDGEYMLGKFGWGYSREGGGEYSPSTGTCLFQVDTGKEIWCREEVLSQEEAYLSEKGGVIAGEKALYDFFSGKKIMKYPQFAKSGDKTLIPQRKNMAIIIRAMSPDGRYFVATEGRCDPERIRQAGKESGCSLGFLRELKTYLGEWEKGDIKRIIRVFSENWDDVNLKPFYFLTDGRLVVYSPYPPRIQLMNVSGEVVAEISNDKASNISQLAISRLQPRIDYSNRVVVWPSADEKDIWRVYGLDGRLVGEFAWKEPQGRESHVRRFAMINDREYIFTVDIVTKKRKTGGTSEYISEVYRGEFQPGDRGR